MLTHAEGLLCVSFCARASHKWCFTSLILTISWKTGAKEMLLWQVVKQTQRSGDLSRCTQTCLHSTLCFPAQNSSHSPNICWILFGAWLCCKHSDITVNKTEANPCFLNEASVLILKHKSVQFENHQGIPSSSVYLRYLKKKKLNSCLHWGNIPVFEMW